jgi:hypothetical protein
MLVLVLDLFGRRVVTGARSCWCFHANLIANRRIEEGIKRDPLLTAQGTEGGWTGSWVHASVRRQGRIADVSKASRLYPLPGIRIRSFFRDSVSPWGQVKYYAVQR